MEELRERRGALVGDLGGGWVFGGLRGCEELIYNLAVTVDVGGLGDGHRLASPVLWREVA